MKTTVICLFGPPASGKNTIGRLLHQELAGSRYLQNHALVDVVTGLFAFESPAAKDLLFALRKELLFAWARSGEGTLITTQVLTADPPEYLELYQEFFRLFRQRGGSPLVVNTFASQATLLERSLNPDRLRFRKVRAAEVQRYIASDFRRSEIDYAAHFPGIPVLPIDTEETDPRAAVSKILERW
jgi:hypothetical protein